MQSREMHRRDILRAINDRPTREWWNVSMLPGHYRRRYSILNELTREGVLQEGTHNGFYAWRKTGWKMPPFEESRPRRTTVTLTLSDPQARALLSLAVEGAEDAAARDATPGDRASERAGSRAIQKLRIAISDNDPLALR